MSVTLRAGGFAAGLLAASLTVSEAFAAGTGNSEAQARYKADRAACMNGTTRQDRNTCLQEAGAALRESRRGNLADEGGNQKARNNRARCDALPQADREDCLRRMRGEGTTTGTAADGGVYRELVTPVMR